MASEYPESANRHPNSRSHASRPTTPLRPSSRSSFRDSARNAGNGEGSFPLAAFEPAFSELSDAVADLEANMMHFQLMHESLSRFSESFASFLYGLNMNAFCVDFPESRFDATVNKKTLPRVPRSRKSAKPPSCKLAPSTRLPNLDC
ncbi:DASH complex subunit DAM1 [Escovopsis weberi]|uniref:DASH complex subunit DAM1 n=1 Tax=Escovopsis weberi TaxID=150374 RepID=A0A0M8N9A0_ESCWE|nr:DASH complex subunit DAM1 [Escovopsis weberi]